MDMDDDTHQTYFMACKRAHQLEDSLKLQGSTFPQKEEKDDKSSSHDSDDDFIPILAKTCLLYTSDAADE